MLQGEHSAILSTFIKLPFVIKHFVLSIFEWPLYTCFTEQLSNGASGLNFGLRLHLCHYIASASSKGPDETEPFDAHIVPKSHELT